LISGNDADRPVVFHGQPTELVDVVLECRHTPQAVVQRVVLPDVRQPLDRVQRLEFGEGEVRGEPAIDRDAVDDLGRLAVREFGVTTSVVWLMSGSWRSTSTPSLVGTRSGSI
jgi:hypothetical protein